MIAEEQLYLLKKDLKVNMMHKPRVTLDSTIREATVEEVGSNIAVATKLVELYNVYAFYQAQNGLHANKCYAEAVAIAIMALKNDTCII